MCTNTDFGVLRRNHTSIIRKVILKRETHRERISRLHSRNHKRVFNYTYQNHSEIIPVAPEMPRANSWGYYYEGNVWHQWTQFRV